MATPKGGWTGRGGRWELVHSIWIVWTFTLGFFNWVGFLYIGVRVRNMRWVAWGALYSSNFVLAMIFAERNQAVIDNIVVPLTLILGIVGIIHAFRIRPEYLRQLSVQEKADAQAAAFYPQAQRSPGAAPIQFEFTRPGGCGGRRAGLSRTYARAFD